MEIKLKWLPNPLKYCRTCSHNKYKGGTINYCYRTLQIQGCQYIKEILKKDDIPDKKLNIMYEYFSSGNNILQKIYNEHSKVYQLVIERGDQDKIPLLKTLRDVTCFLR